MIGLPHNFLLSCFISRLKPHIRQEFQALQSVNLMHATDLAKLQEDKFSKLCKFPKSNYNNQSNPSYQSSYQSSSLPSANLSQPLLPKPTTNIPVKKPSSSVLQDCRTTD